MNVMGYDYTGYGCSSGEPSVAASIVDLDTVVDCLLDRFKLQPSDIVLYGQSVGSGAPFTASLRPYASLILSAVAGSGGQAGLVLWNWSNPGKTELAEVNL